jgi:hypothetical protein
MIKPMIALGIVLAGSHVIFLVIIVGWFALKKPTSWALVRSRFKEAMAR